MVFQKSDSPLDYSADCQAKRIILRFGGVAPLLKLMLQAGRRRTSQSIYSWLKAGGLIPPNGVRDVWLAERQAGITLTDQDWSPYPAGALRGAPVVQDCPVAQESPEVPPEPPEASGDPSPPQGGPVESLVAAALRKARAERVL